LGGKTGKYTQVKTQVIPGKYPVR